MESGAVKQKMNDTEFIVKEYPNHIYSLSTPLWMKRERKGGAIMQTWLVAGSKAVLAIDSPFPEIPGFRAYIEKMFRLPVLMLNTHGHVDHIGCNGQFEKVYLAKEDWTLAAGGGVQRSEDENAWERLGYEVADIPDGFRITLGNRELTAYHLPGHTKGCVVLYEEATSTLFGGDAVARRVLYGMSDWTPLEDYLEKLREIAKLKIAFLYSMHDDFALLNDMPARIISHIEKNLERTEMIWESPVDARKFKRILLGENEEDLAYFDFVLPLNGAVSIPKERKEKGLH